MINFIEHRTWSYIFSGILILASVVSMSVWGLKQGIDFTGGSLMELQFNEARPAVAEIETTLNPLDLGNIVVQPAGEREMILRFRDVSETEHQSILQAVRSTHGEITELRFETVGPTLGAEMWRRAMWAVGVALFLIIVYIAWAFRKVARPVASWKYGLTAILALAHNTIITLGAFSVLGHFAGAEIDSLFVTALLTLLGFSVHDTIVVYDRTRENLFKQGVKEFADTVNKSLNDTLVRSINTGMCTLLVLVGLFLFGGESIKYFSLALIIGITVGTYSSIFISSPLLVDWARFSKR